MSRMTEREFDLLISLILSMLKGGKVDEVIRLLEETRDEKESSDK